MRISKKQIARFWSNVQKTDSCWLWLRQPNNKGYGKVTIRPNSQERVMLLAHRLAWLLVKGEIPDGLFVLHKCDTPLCCNPEHLFLGTQQDNMGDMWAKGRSRLHEFRHLGTIAAHTEVATQKRKDTFIAIEHQKGKRNSQFGSFWITDGKVNKKWRSELGCIPSGFFKGRSKFF